MTIRIMAAPIRTPIWDPIAAFIWAENAGLPDTVTFTPAGGWELSTRDWILLRVAVLVSSERPSLIGICTSVRTFEGTATSRVASGICRTSASISPFDWGSTPLFSLLRISTTLDALAMFCCCRISPSSRFM